MAKLLIVDDEPATVDMISMFMEINGYEWIGAYNGTDGLVLLEVEKPDMLIVDLMMPDIEGFEVCRRMRERDTFSKTPILVISARTDQSSIEKAYSSGANGYLTKPLNLPQLLGEVKRLITQQAG
jgi:DNA-binding response OmpR family regulator